MGRARFDRVLRQARARPIPSMISRVLHLHVKKRGMSWFVAANDIWVDERAAKVYAVYMGDLVRFSLKKP